jgi:hypothetical protein
LHVATQYANFSSTPSLCFASVLVHGNALQSIGSHALIGVVVQGSVFGEMAVIDDMSQRTLSVRNLAGLSP